MQKLLTHVSDGLYDGVLVMDIDRLGRGEQADWARICKAFLWTDTYVITPQQIYDLSQEQDEMVFDFQAVFAKMEYKMIKKCDRVKLLVLRKVCGQMAVHLTHMYIIDRLSRLMLMLKN